MTSQDTADTTEDIWVRLRDYCEFHHALYYPPLTEEQAHEWKQRGISKPSELSNLHMNPSYRFIQQIVCYQPATEEQLRITEEKLGFPLPSDLRRFYSEVANGGLNLGIAYVFHGAVGGCGIYADARSDGETIEELTCVSGWRLHPRIEEALLRRPGRYVVADSEPDKFIWICGDSDISVMIDAKTGYIYDVEGWGYFPDTPSESWHRPFDLLSLEIVAPSLSEWFEQWMAKSWGQTAPNKRGVLLPDMVETDDLPDPDEVWRGICRFETEWRLQPVETDLAHDAEHAVYWAYVEEAEREQAARNNEVEHWVGEPPDDWFTD